MHSNIALRQGELFYLFISYSHICASPCTSTSSIWAYEVLKMYILSLELASVSRNNRTCVCTTKSMSKAKERDEIRTRRDRSREIVPLPGRGSFSTLAYHRYCTHSEANGIGRSACVFCTVDKTQLTNTRHPRVRISSQPLLIFSPFIFHFFFFSFFFAFDLLSIKNKNKNVYSSNSSGKN